MSSTGIIVTEPVYAEQDGRTFLAAAVGDELSEAQALLLSVGKDGKSTNGIGPATSLQPAQESELPGSVGMNEPAPPTPVPVPVVTQTDAPLPDGFEALNAKDASQAVAAFDAATLDAIETAENARTGEHTPRSSVLKAIEKRRDALKAGE